MKMIIEFGDNDTTLNRQSAICAIKYVDAYSCVNEIKSYFRTIRKYTNLEGRTADEFFKELDEKVHNIIDSFELAELP